MKIRWKAIGLIALVWADLLVFLLIGFAIHLEPTPDDDPRLTDIPAVYDE